MKTCIIMSAGDFTPEDLHKEEGDILIAADNGLSHLADLGEEPDYIIGDYDSLNVSCRSALEAFRQGHPERERTLPKAKDDTDTMAAVRWGFELGFSQFRLYGALGGERVDHTVANLQTLMFIASRGGRGVILDGRQELFLMRNESIAFPPERCGMFSLFAVDPSVHVTIRGMLYECGGAEITYDFPIGCSNEFLPGQAGFVDVQGGTALVVAQR